MKGYYKNDSEKVLTLGITIDVLIKDFGEGKLSDDKKLSKMEEDMLLLNEIDIQYIMSTMEINLIDQLIKWRRNIFTSDNWKNWKFIINKSSFNYFI